MAELAPAHHLSAVIENMLVLLCLHDRALELVHAIPVLRADDAGDHRAGVLGVFLATEGRLGMG
eukprot:3359460-Alexandrium_andersonii.AAC.1